jgi:PAS domain-containing protein
LSYFEDFWTQALSPEQQVVSLVRGDGEVLARWPSLKEIPDRVPEGSPFHSLIRTAPKGSYAYTSAADGLERLYGYAKLGTLPGYIIVGADRAGVLKAWRHQTIWFATLAGVISLSLMGTVLMALRREQRLSQEVERRRQAESTLVAKDEHLTALSRAESALRHSEQKFRALFDSLLQGAAFVDPNGLITSVNPAAELILNRPSDTLIGQNFDSLGLNSVDDAGHALAADQQPVGVALRTGMILNGLLMSLERGQSDNERRWLVADAIPLRRPGRETPTEVCILFSDVTDKRRAEDAQRILTREVDHRAKNALAVAQALVRLTRANSHAEFVAALEGRIAC